MRQPPIQTQGLPPYRITESLPVILPADPIGAMFTAYIRPLQSPQQAWYAHPQVAVAGREGHPVQTKCRVNIAYNLFCGPNVVENGATFPSPRTVRLLVTSSSARGDGLEAIIIRPEDPPLTSLQSVRDVLSREQVTRMLEYATGVFGDRGFEAQNRAAHEDVTHLMSINPDTQCKGEGFVYSLLNSVRIKKGNRISLPKV